MNDTIQVKSIQCNCNEMGVKRNEKVLCTISLRFTPIWLQLGQIIIIVCYSKGVLVEGHRDKIYMRRCEFMGQNSRDSPEYKYIYSDSSY